MKRLKINRSKNKIILAKKTHKEINNKPKLNVSDVSAWTCTWPWTVLKHKNQVLGLVLGVEDQVLGLGLGLVTQNLNLSLALNICSFQVQYDV